MQFYLLSEFLLKSFNQSGRSASGSFESFLSLLFFILVLNFCEWRQCPGCWFVTFALILNLKMNLKQVAPVPWLLVPPLFSNESCDSDAEDELLPELTDSPGTTRGTKLSVLQIIVFPSLVNCGF